MAVGDIYEVRAYGRQGDDISQVVRHYRVSAGAGTEVAVSQAIPASFRIQVLDHWISIQHESFSWVRIRVVRVLPTPGVVTNFDLSGEQGTNTAAPMPGYVAAQFSVGTDIGGKGQEGRSFVPGLTSDFVDGDTLDDTAGAMTGNAHALTNNLTASGDTLEPVLLNRKTGVASKITRSWPKLTVTHQDRRHSKF